MKKLSDKKLQNELDLSRIIKKIRKFESLTSYLLTERQKYLLRFNYDHVIDTESDLISLDSAESLFSVPEEDSDRLETIRQRVMFRLVAGQDPRDAQCAFKMFNRELEKGVSQLNPDIDESLIMGNQQQETHSYDGLTSQQEQSGYYTESMSQTDIAFDRHGVETRKKKRVDRSKSQILNDDFFAPEAPPLHMNFNTVHTQLDDGAQQRVDTTLIPFHPETDQPPVDYKLYGGGDDEPSIASGPQESKAKK